MSLLGASMLLGAEGCAVSLRGHLREVLHPGERDSPRLVANPDSASPCRPKTPLHPRPRTLRPLVGSPGEALRTEGRGGASGSPSRLPPAPPRPRGLDLARSPGSVPQPGPSSCASSAASYTRGRPPRPPWSVRSAVRPDTAVGQPAESFLRAKRRDGTGRGGAERREEERLEEGERGRPLLPYRKPLGRPLTGAAPSQH